MTQRKQWSWITGIGLSAALALAGCGSDTSKDTSKDVGDTSAAMLAGSPFESNDGNLVVNGGAGAQDWANAPNFTQQIDLPSGSADNSFGGGTKEDSLTVTVGTGSIPPNKSDLSRFYVAHDRGTNGDYFLYLAWERTNVLGSANMDFELNQLAQPNLLTTGTKTLNRKAGDILITFDFTQGGGNPVLGLLTWVTSGPTSQCFASNSLPCWGNRVELSAAHIADGAVNAGTVTDPISGASLPALTFGEAAIDLTAAGVFPPNVCVNFGSAFLKSRSSPSFTAEAKDFIAPVPVSITNCGSIHIEKSFTGVASPPFPVATFTAYKDGTIDPSDATKCVGTATDSCTTLASTGSCDIPGVFAGSYCVAETATPTGFFTANAQVKNVPADATITYSFVDVPKRTLQIVKKDDLGNNVSGAAFALCSGTVTALCGSPVGTCSTGSTNTCSIGNLGFGDYTLFETTVPIGYFSGISSTGLPVSIQSGDADPKVVTVNNPRKFRIITLVCVEATNSLYSSSVTENGVTLSSIGTAAVPSGVTEATLCGIGGARFTGLPTGTFSESIVIGTQPQP